MSDLLEIIVFFYCCIFIAVLLLLNDGILFVDKIMTETLPIDSLMIDRWTNQWMKQLGFNNEQLSKRNHKVEQFTRVCDENFN
jgi:hypothetical protein